MSSGNFQKTLLNNFTIFTTLKENKIILHQYIYIYIYIFFFLIFISFNYLVCHDIHSHFEYIFVPAENK